MKDVDEDHNGEEEKLAGRETNGDGAAPPAKKVKLS